MNAVAEVKDSNSRNLTLEVREQALARPHAPAIVLADRTLSYADLDDAVLRSARWLREADIRPGMIVGLIMRDQIALLLAMLGLMRVGATPFPISANAPALQQEELLQASSARFSSKNPCLAGKNLNWK